MTYRPRRIFAYSSAVLSWLRTIALLVVFSFMVLIVPFARARVYMCGRAVGWLVGCGVRATLVWPRARGAGVCGRPGGVVACLVLCGRGIGLVRPWWVCG